MLDQMPPQASPEAAGLVGTAPQPVFRRVLVPVDGSALAEAILPFVQALAAPLRLEVVLLSVVPRIPPQLVEGAPEVVVDNMERLREETDAYVTALAGRVRAGGLSVLTDVRIGDIPAQILDAADTWEADLIAMTTHGRSGLSRLAFGSVAEEVLRHARVPVFIKRAQEPEAQRSAA